MLGQLTRSMILWWRSKHLGVLNASALLSRATKDRERRRLTGKTSGIPPRTGLEPSRRALELRKRFSLPLADFQDVTVAPCNRTSTFSPVGSCAVTRELSSEMETCGEGWMGETGIAAGFLARSIVRRERTWMCWRKNSWLRCQRSYDGVWAVSSTNVDERV